eukprot:3964133-Karenia_brevis.AAC.1
MLCGHHAEHALRALDASSRRLLTSLWDLPAPAEHFILMIVVFVRVVLVDNAPIAEFLSLLRQ